MNGEYRWVRYTIAPTDDGFYVHGDEIDVAGPYSTVASAHAGARKLIDEMLQPPEQIKSIYFWLMGLGFFISLAVMEVL